MSIKEETILSFIPSLVAAGFTQLEAEEIAVNTNLQEKQQILEEIDKPTTTTTTTKKPVSKMKKSDGFISALILAGFSGAVSSGIAEALSDDEEVIRLLLEGKTPVMFMTQKDSKVDDKICLPKQGEVWDKDDPNRPRVPLDTHPNCRCFYQDPITGRNLGQF